RYATEVATNFLCFTVPATSALSTLSLHDALPISAFEGERAELVLLTQVPRRLEEPLQGEPDHEERHQHHAPALQPVEQRGLKRPDRKSTRLNSSHVSISYAVFCLKKKKQRTTVPG